MTLIDTSQLIERTGVTRSQLKNWGNRGLTAPQYRIGDRLIGQAEADRLYPGGLSWPLWDEAATARVTGLLHLTRYGMTAAGAGRLLDELAARPGAPVLLAPGIVVRASACTCPEDCDPFRAVVLAAQIELRPAVAL